MKMKSFEKKLSKTLGMKEKKGIWQTPMKMELYV